MKYKLLLVFSCLFFTWMQGQAQTNNDDRLVQFSGMVLDGTNQELIPVPYTNVLVKGKGRGTYTDFDGFFSIVAEKGDEIEFSAIGYKTVNFIIPDSLEDSRYSLIQLMTQDAINLPETVVFPWPSKEHFKLEFLAMDVTSNLQAKATSNTAADILAQMREEVINDGRENANHYLRQQSREFYYIGQTPPMNIFNPIAWKGFFDAWKRGDFKKKK